MQPTDISKIPRKLLINAILLYSITPIVFFLLAALKKQYGFDRPLHVRYGLWLKNIVTLNFGESFSYEEPVIDVISSKLPVSLQFGVVGRDIARDSFGSQIKLANACRSHWFVRDVFVAPRARRADGNAGDHCRVRAPRAERSRIMATSPTVSDSRVSQSVRRWVLTRWSDGARPGGGGAR